MRKKTPAIAASALPAPRVRPDTLALVVVAVVAVLAAGFWYSQGGAARQDSSSSPVPAVLSAPTEALGKSQLVEVALRHPDVRAYAQRNSGYSVEDRFLTLSELGEEAKRYPVIYGGLSAPVYRLRFSSPSGEGLLVLLTGESVLRVFAVQSLRVG